MAVPVQPDRSIAAEKIGRLPDGLPSQFQGEDGEARLEKLLGITNRRTRLWLAGTGPVRDVAKILTSTAKRSFRRPGPREVIARAYANPYFRAAMLDSCLARIEAEGPDVEEVTIPSLEYRALRQYRPDAWTRRFSGLEALAEILDDEWMRELESDSTRSIRSALTLWKDMRSDLEQWDDLNETQRENLTLAVFTTMVLLREDVLVRKAIALQPALDATLGHLRISASPADESIEPEEEEPSKEDPQAAVQRLSGTLAEIAGELAHARDLTVLKDLPLQLSALAEELEALIDQQVEAQPAPAPAPSWENALAERATLLADIAERAQLAWLKEEVREEARARWETAFRDGTAARQAELLKALAASQAPLVNARDRCERAIAERAINDTEIATLSTPTPGRSDEIAARLARLTELQQRQHQIASELLLAGNEVNEALYPPEAKPVEPEAVTPLIQAVPAAPTAVAEAPAPVAPQPVAPVVTRAPVREPEAPPPVVEEEQVPEPARVGVDPREIAKRFLESQAPRRTPDAQAQADLLWAIVDQGLLPAAYWFLQSLERAGQRTSDLPVPGLLRAALLASAVVEYGQPAASLYGDTLVGMDIAATDRLLEHGDQLGLRAIGIAASLQPSLFCPSSLSAQLLRASTHGMPPEFGAVLRDIARLADQGINVTRRDLAGFHETSSVSDDLKVLQEAVKEFRKRAVEKHTGYFWAREAIQHAVTRGPLAVIIETIGQDDVRQLGETKRLVSDYATTDAVERLLEESLRAVQVEHTKNIPTIVGPARKSFFHYCAELVQFANRWVALHERGRYRSDARWTAGVTKIISHLSTQLPRAIQHFRTAHDNTEWLADRAGLQVGIQALENLQQRIAGSEDATVGEEVVAALDLPRRMLGSPWDGEGEPGTAVAIARFAEGGFDHAGWARRAMRDGNLGLARDVIAEIRRRDADAPLLASLDRELASAAAEHKSRVAKQLQRARHAINDAYYARLLEEKEYQDDVALIEYLAEDSRAQPYPDLEDTYRQCQEIDERLRQRQETRLDELRKEWTRLREQAENSPRKSEIPEGWLEGLDRSLQEQNITVAEEHLGQLEAFISRGEPLVDYRAAELIALRDFLSAEPQIYEALKGKSLRDVAHRIGLGETVAGIDFSKSHDRSNEALRSLEALSTPRRNIAQADLQHLYNVLGGVGFDYEAGSAKNLVETRHEAGSGMATLTLRLRVGPRESPFPAFGSLRGGLYRILVVWKYRSFEEIGQFINGVDPHQPMFVIMPSPLAPEQRREWARFCHQRRQSLPLLDPVVLVYLGASKEGIRAETRLRRAFRILLPFTYGNPYLNTLRPPPDEMFFGREQDVAEVMRQGGAAILYGGRQLGKSTILQQAERRFHRPADHCYSWIRSLDTKLEGVPYESIVRRFWEDMRDDLRRNKLLSNQKIESAQQTRNALRDVLLRNRQLRILVLLDEADKFLLADSRNDFTVCRELRGLSYDTEGRFKVVIAGLANVQRYSNMPNFPLTQLGTIRRVGIMPTADAMRLIREPLSAAGYTFEDPRFVNRILAYTNQHPGLIQVFCHHLVEHLNRLARAKAITVPDYAITDSDISATYERPDVRHDIVDRFNLTLRLDPRYQVLAYGAILSDTGLSEFNLTQAHRIGEAYWPEEFVAMSVTRLRAILDEMEGLGVLTHRKGEGGEDLYRLRNTNVFRLLGGKEQMERELADIKVKGESDPLERHRPTRDPNARAPARIAIVPSPLSIGDELQILGRRVEPGDLEAPVVSEGSPFTVSCVFGSAASGIEELVTGLRTLNELEAKDVPYVVHEVPSSRAGTIAALRDATRDALAKSRTTPTVIVVRMPHGQDPTLHSEIVDFVYSLKPPSSRHPLRIVLAFGPGASWEWLGNADYPAIEREGIVLPLNRWGPSALSAILGELAMLDGPAQVAELEQLTGGWYKLISGFAKAKRESATAVDRPGLVTEYVTKIAPDAADQARAARALAHLGVTDVEHAVDLLQAIHEMGVDEVNAEWVRMVAEEKPQWRDLAEEAERLIAWLRRLGILVPRASGALAIETTVRTYLSRAARG